MYLFFLIGMVSVLVASLSKRYKYALEISFAIFTFFFAIRYNFGADYEPYLMHFSLANGSATLQDAQEFTVMEPGFIFLYRLFNPIGFFGMVIVLTVFEQYVLYRIIKKYVPSKWYWLAVFSYIFSVSLCLTGLSMMRQFLAMSICLLAIDISLDGKKIKIILSLLLVVLAMQFHTSAAIMFPLCFVGWMKDIKISGTGSIVLCFILIVFSIAGANFLGGYIQSLTQGGIFERYEENFGIQYNRKFGLSDLIEYAVPVIILSLQNKQTPTLRKVFLIFSLYLVVDAFRPLAPMIGRLGYYFYLWLPVCLPVAISKVDAKNKQLITLFVIAFMFIKIYSYFSFILYPGGWGNAFIEYQTIFSAPRWM